MERDCNACLNSPFRNYPYIMMGRLRPEHTQSWVYKKERWAFGPRYNGKSSKYKGSWWNLYSVKHPSNIPPRTGALSCCSHLNMFRLLFKFGDWELDYFNDLWPLLPLLTLTHTAGQYLKEAFTSGAPSPCKEASLLALEGWDDPWLVLGLVWEQAHPQSLHCACLCVSSPSSDPYDSNSDWTPWPHFNSPDVLSPYSYNCHANTSPWRCWKWTTKDSPCFPLWFSLPPTNTMPPSQPPTALSDAQKNSRAMQDQI